MTHIIFHVVKHSGLVWIMLLIRQTGTQYILHKETTTETPTMRDVCFSDVGREKLFNIK